MLIIKLKYETPVDNGWFCESGGVFPPEHFCKFASAPPAQAFVHPPSSQSRWDVICKRTTARANSEVKDRQGYIKFEFASF